MMIYGTSKHGHRFQYLNETVQLRRVVNNGVARTLKKVTHIKGRLLDEAMILYKNVPFGNGNFSSLGANFFLYEQFFMVWKFTYHNQVTSLECYYFYYARA